MKKYVALFLILLFALPLVGCAYENPVLDEMRSYEVATEIHSLDIHLNAADFVIEYGETFGLESNLKYLSVTEKNGVLTIVDNKTKGNRSYNNAKLTLYIPHGTVFDDVSIEIGAAKLTAETLSTASLRFELGAGDVSIKQLNVTSHADIEGGTGAITVAGGTLNNLKLEMGVGELNLTAALLGNNELDFGIGESNLTVLGSKQDYRIDIEKGLGSVTVDGEKVTDFGTSGGGQHSLEIEAGIGAVNLKFQETE